MSKDYFQRNAELANQLRTQQFKIRQYIQKGKYRMKQKFFNKGKKHYDFDLNSQEYFHEEINDVCFETSEVQEQYSTIMMKYLQQPLQFKHQMPYQIPGIPNHKHQAEIRQLLHRFFSNRVQDLEYEKYLIMERLNNINSQNQFTFIRSRINLIDKQILMALSRTDRLSCEDFFQQTYTQGNKPVPINQSGQSIYKYLDQEDCWYSNIQREDILIYTRSQLFRRQILHNHFYPTYYEHKYTVKTYGIDILKETEYQLAKERQRVKEEALRQSRNMIDLFQTELELISPSNLIEKENICSYIYYTFGVEEDQVPLCLSLYPAIVSELLQNYNKVLPCFFKSLQIKDHKELMSLLPKFNNFSAILFKYQNKQVLEGKQEIKLGLDDDIDIKKELNTMLEQIWTKKYVKIDFERFDIRYRLKTIDWPLDTLTQQHQRQRQHQQTSSHRHPLNTQIQTMINILKSTNYSSFRKHLKRHSETVCSRLKDKFNHMERVNKYNVLNNEEHTLEQLGDMFRIKFNSKETHTASMLKPNAQIFFDAILKKHLVINPVEIQMEEMMRMIKLRQNRVKLLGMFNGMRCYHRNLALDLRVISQMQFKFHLDDQMLINANKQVLQNFEKAVKDTQTFFSKDTNDSTPIRMTQQQFVQHNTYQKSKLYKKDRVNFNHFGQEIPHVLVSNGHRLKHKILYEICNQDIEQVQQRILRNCTIIINRYQRYLKIKSLDQLVDRVQLLSLVYDLELRYQYQKLQLIENYYYLYQNTKQPLQAFKLSNIIVKLIHKQPKLDLQEPSLQQAYLLNISCLAQQRKIVNQMVNQLEKVEAQQCRTFHDKFAKSLNIPLTLQAYLYGDIQKKGNKGGGKLQRMNSFSSKLSKDSKLKQQKFGNIISQIKEQFQEIDQEEQDDSFDIQKYDEYLLRKNMDAIFDDMMGDQGQKVKEAVPVSSVAIENLVVNPRFEGGPHIKANIFPQVPLTSDKSQNLINFNEVASIVGNIHYLIEELQEEFQTQFGFVSTLYQLEVLNMISKRMYKSCLSPTELPPKWLPFQTDDPYHETVSKGIKYYQQIMSACLQPPSNVQLAIKSTYDRHHEKMPVFGSLQYFDYHSLHSLILLKKPVNSFRYKEHNLGLGFIELLQLQDSIWMMQLQRREISASYRNLGKQCDMVLQRSVSEYINTGQSQIFWATQQNKFYNTDITKYPIYPDMLQQLRQYFRCQLTDLQVFKKHIQVAKRQLTDLLIMKYELDKGYLNKRLDRGRLLAPKDLKDIKKIKNRIIGLVSMKASDVLKTASFLKYKNKLKVTLQTKLKEISERDYQSKIQNKDKMSAFCICILTSKYKKHLQMKLLRSYSEDLMLTVGKLNVCTQTLTSIQKLKNYTISVPFLANIFNLPTEDKIMDTKVFYDQAKPKKIVELQFNSVSEGEVVNPYYIYTQEQFMDQWSRDCSGIVSTNLDKFSSLMEIDGLNPPNSKEAVFKWAFNIPQIKIDANEKQAVTHLLKVFHPFTGKLTPFSYQHTQYPVPLPPRNKYLNLMQHYKSLVDYIEANILMISLQVQDDILQSLQSIIKKKVNFQERYFMTDQNSIRQTINNLQNQDLSIVFNLLIDFVQMNKQVQKKMDDRNYLDKKEHWVVHDEVIDFIMSKIQGYGLIRQNYLPLCDDLKLLGKLKGGKSTQFLLTKTRNIHKLIYLSGYQTYLNQINQNNSDFYAYHPQLNEWLCHSSQLQNYLCSEQSNNHVNLSKHLDYSEQERQKFNNGIYNKSSKMLNDKMKYVVPAASHNSERFIQKVLFKEDLLDQQICSYQHNQHFMKQAMQMFKFIGQKNRFKVFARIRYHYDLSDQFIQTKPAHIMPTQKEIFKSSFYDLLINKKIFTLASINFTGRVNLPVNAKSFKSTYMELKEVNQIHTHNLYQNLQRFKEDNKIQFSRWETNLIGKNEGSQDQYYNNTIRLVISVKLLKEQFKYRVLSQAVRLIRTQKVPKAQPKRIMNPSLIPRVHLISSYSSPLIIDRKSYVSQQYKLSFLQAFINRFRNKVSRVDLLSSGYGFVITVPDLQDCVNYMNKLLFTFTQKQFKFRIQTFSQYAEIMMQSINDKNKVINQQAALIKYLQNKNNNLLEAEYLGKVTKLLHQKTLLQDKLLTVQNNINGLEDRVRKTVQIQYQKKISKLEKQNQQLRQIFSKVKHLHMVNTRQAAKNDYLDIVNYYREKINDVLSKKIDFSISFEDQHHSKNNRRVKEENNSSKYREKEGRQDQKYFTEDLSRCKIGEDILFDPYYTTKLINKMRLFNLFRMGSKRLKFQTENFRKDEKLGQLSKIQDMVVTQSERQVLVRNQFKKIQEELSRKCIDLQKLKSGFDLVQNQKTKLKILMQSKEKKIQQKQRQLQQLKQKYEEKDRLMGSIEKQRNVEKIDDIPKLSSLRKEKKYKKNDKAAFLTHIEPQSNQNTVSLFDRFELSNKDGTWREKCQQLYLQNKKMQIELQKYQVGVPIIPNTPKRDGFSLNMRARRDSSSQQSSMKSDPRFPNISFKYNLMKQ